MNSPKNIEAKNGIIYCAPNDLPKVKGMGSTLFRKMLKNKDQVAQIDGPTGKKETYEQLLQRCVRVAITMRSKGVTKDDIVAICSDNHLNTFDPLFAGLFLGTKVAALDPRLSLSDTIHLLKQVRPKMIFASPSAVELLEQSLQEIQISTEIIVFGEPQKHLDYSAFLSPSPDEEKFEPVEVEDVKETALIIFSSGTTGLSKGVCLSHFGMMARQIEAEAVGEPSGLKLMAFSSPYWISSEITLLHSIFTSSARVIFPGFNPKDIWSWIEKYEVNVLFMSVSQWLALSKNGGPTDTNPSSLMYGIMSGSHISKEQIIYLKEILPNTVIVNSYGLTELNGYGLALTPFRDPIDFKIYEEKPHSLGRPIPGFSYKVVDIETEKLLGPNQSGELRIKTEFQMNGYLNHDSSNAWDSNGFLKTGDVVYYDEDYSFYYVDRIKEMLKFQSWQIAPVKLEAILIMHPVVESAVVIGLPHPEDGDHPMGLVVLKKSAKDAVSAEELEKYVEERVDERQRLRGGVKIVKELPTTPSGKFKRRHIRNLQLQDEL